MMIDGIKNIFKFILPKTRLNKSLRILVTTNSIFIFAFGLFGPFYAIFVQRIGGTIAFAGFSWAIFSIISGVLIFLFSNWELKVKEQELLIAFGYLLRSGVFISYAYMGSLTQLILTQVIWGIGAALATPAFDSVYAKHTTQEDSIVQWGGWEGISAIATGVAALIGGVVIEELGFKVLFLIMAVISFALGLYIWKLPREVL